ncbi:MAG: restriction endonuclease subunit S [Verrucomicrobiota bacterium]
MLDLRPDQLATVRAILQAEVPECEVWAFGSRAKWTAKDSSDLDLALVASERLPLSKLGRLREAFKDSYLPTKVDVVDVNRVSDEFRRIIESQHVVLQKPGAAAAKQNGRAQWQTLPLEECVETIIDYRGKTPTKVSSGIPLITAKVVKNGRIETPDEFIAEADYDGWMRRGIPRAGDVLLTMEAPLGEVAQLDDRKVALAQRLVALRGKQGLLDNWYLKYLLQSVLVQDQLKSRATGTTVLGIKQSELRKINLALPPLAEQRAIAEVLGALDDKIELNQRTNETLEAQAQTIFQSWFVEPATTKLPKGWREVPFTETIKILGGGTPKTSVAEYWNGNIPWFSVVDAPQDSDVFVIDTAKKITQAGVDNSSTQILPVGTTIISARGTVGKIALVGVPMAMNQSCYGLRGKAGTKGFHTYFATRAIVSTLQQHAHGSVFDTITQNTLAGIQVAAPPEARIDQFEETVSPLMEHIRNNLFESRALVALRDTLLPKLLSGELRVPVAGKEKD